MRDYKSLLEKYGPESVPVTILDDEFLVKKLSANEAEALKVYGMEASLSDDSKLKMEINKDEWVKRSAMILHKCLCFPDGTQVFDSVDAAGAVGSTFFKAALDKVNEFNDLAPEAVEEAEKN